jgi:hypothetical protein
LDIAGAKALKKRLGRAAEARPAAADVDIPEDAPPVYHWLGVKQAAPEARPVAEDDAADQAASLFRRLALGFR